MKEPRDGEERGERGGERRGICLLQESVSEVPGLGKEKEKWREFTKKRRVLANEHGRVRNADEASFFQE